MSIFTNTVLISITGWTLVLAPATLVSDGTIHDAFPAVTASLVDGPSVTSFTTRDPATRPLPGPPPIEVAPLPLQ